MPTQPPNTDSTPPSPEPMTALARHHRCTHHTPARLQQSADAEGGSCAVGAGACAPIKPPNTYTLPVVAAAPKDKRPDGGAPGRRRSKVRPARRTRVGPSDSGVLHTSTEAC
eukprot:3140329-Rhodomonas_salina.1